MLSKSTAPGSRTAAAPAAGGGGAAAAAQPHQFSRTRLIQAASAMAMCSSPQVGMNNNGVNLEKQTVSSAAECCDRCLAVPGCKGYTLLEGGDCWLKSKLDPLVSDQSATSGSVGNEP